MAQCRNRAGHLPASDVHAEGDKASHIPFFPPDSAAQAGPSTRCACSQRAPPKRAVGSVACLTLWSTKRGQSALCGRRGVLTACWLAQPCVLRWRCCCQQRQLDMVTGVALHSKPATALWLPVDLNRIQQVLASLMQ